MKEYSAYLPASSFKLSKLGWRLRLPLTPLKALILTGPYGSWWPEPLMPLKGPEAAQTRPPSALHGHC